MNKLYIIEKYNEKWDYYTAFLIVSHNEVGKKLLEVLQNANEEDTFRCREYRGCLFH